MQEVPDISHQIDIELGNLFPQDPHPLYRISNHSEWPKEIICKQLHIIYSHNVSQIPTAINTCIICTTTVDPVINDPATNDLLSPTTFFSCTDNFSIVNDLWSTTFCLTRLATSNIWQKVIILLVSNDLNFFRHTTFGNIHEQTTACQIWLCGYHG